MQTDAFVPPEILAKSPYARHAWRYIERGISPLPIAPGTKTPGTWTQEHGWRSMPAWTRYSERLPTEIEQEHRERWPDAQIGITLGKLSGVVGLDRDYDTNGTDALDAIIPYTPFRKKGEKGWTGFYRYNGEKSCSFNVGGKRVLDVLSDGRQSAHLSARVVMVYVQALPSSRRVSADRARAALGSLHRVEFVLAHSVLLAQVLVPSGDLEARKVVLPVLLQVAGGAQPMRTMGARRVARCGL